MFSGYRVSLWDEAKVLEMDRGEDGTNTVNIPNTTELYGQNLLKQSILCSAYLTTIKTDSE